MRQIFFALLLGFSLSGLAQEDWKLPMRNDVIQFEYNSKSLNTSDKLCVYYTQAMFGNEVMTTLSKELDDKGNKLLSSTRYMVIPQLHSVNINMSDPQALMQQYQNRCKGDADTLFGQLTINITKSTVRFNGSIKASGGKLICNYRIVLLGKDKFQVKYRGFVLTTTTYQKGRINQEEYELESIYTSTNPSKSEKSFYKDIKYIITTYNETIEKLLKRKSKSTSGWDD